MRPSRIPPLLAPPPLVQSLQYREMLTARDYWGRSLIEHSIRSGSSQVFEAVLDAVREDVHDEKVTRVRVQCHPLPHACRLCAQLSHDLWSLDHVTLAVQYCLHAA